MRVLVLCDDIWHPAEIVRQGLAGLETAGFAFDYLTKSEDWSGASMETYPVVILAKANNISSQDRSPWMTPEIEKAFQQYVRAGGGLLVLHAGTAGYEKTGMFRKLLGGVFREHPEQCPVTVEVVPASASFTLVDEHYMIDLDDQGADIFMTTRSEHGSQPGGWKRTEGAGRVCVLTPGHNLDVWQNPVYQQTLDEALRWCGNKQN